MQGWHRNSMLYSFQELILPHVQSMGGKASLTPDQFLKVTFETSHLSLFS